MKREVVISVTRKPKNLVAPQDGVGKSQTPGLANRREREKFAVITGPEHSRSSSCSWPSLGAR